MTREDGSEEYARLVRPHYERLYRLAWRLAGPAEAEDLFQELMVKGRPLEHHSRDRAFRLRIDAG